MFSTLTKEALELAPLDWKEFAAKLTADQSFELWNELDNLVQWAATLGTYIDNIRMQSHDGAVKAAMRRRVAVRKALGYTYPKSGAFTF